MKTFVLACLFIGATAAASISQTRLRRDVSEIVAPGQSYLPPMEMEMDIDEGATEIAPKDAFEIPQDTAVLGDSGYEYQTIRKLKYRTRRDVSELISRNYLPPTLKLSSEYLPPVRQAYEIPTEAPVEMTVEPQTSEVPFVREAPVSTTEAPEETSELPQDTAIFADDGYHYKKPEEIPQLVPREYLPPVFV